MLRNTVLALCVLFAATAYAAQFEAEYSGAVYDADISGEPGVEGVTLDALQSLAWSYRDGNTYREGRLDAKVAGTARSGAGGTFLLKLTVTYDETKLPKPLAELTVKATLRGSKDDKLGATSFEISPGIKSTILFPVQTSVRILGKAVAADGKTPLSGVVAFEAMGTRDLFSGKLEADGTFKVAVLPDVSYSLRVGEMVVAQVLHERRQKLSPTADTDLGPVRFARPGTLALDFEGLDLGRNGYLDVRLEHEAGIELSIRVAKEQLKHECILPPGTATVFYFVSRDQDPLQIKRVIVSDEVQSLHVKSELPRDILLTGVELDYYQRHEVTLTAASGESFRAVSKSGRGGGYVLVVPNVPVAAATYTLAGTIEGYLPFSFEVALKPETTELELKLVAAPTLTVTVKHRDGQSELADVYVAPKGHELDLLFAKEGLEAAQDWLYQSRMEGGDNGVITGNAQSKIALPPGEYFVLSSIYSSAKGARVPVFAYTTVAESGAHELELRESRSKATLILSRDGKLLANTKVILWDGRTLDVAQQGETDANGRWVISGLYSGDYAVLLAGEDLFWGTGDDECSAELELRQIAHGNVDAEYQLDLTYRHLCQLTLTLELPADKSCEGYFYSSAKNAFGAAKITKHFEISGATVLEPMLLPPGEYKVFSLEFVANNLSWPLFTETISVSAGSQALKLTPKLRSIVGRVELGGLKGVKKTTVRLIPWLGIYDAVEMEAIETEVQPDGSFVLMPIPTTEFTIQASAELEDGTTALAFLDGNGHDGPFTATLKPEVRRGRVVVSFESPHLYDAIVFQYRVPGGEWTTPGLDAHRAISRKHEAIHLDGLPLGDLELRGIGEYCELLATKVKVEAAAKLVPMKATRIDALWFRVQEMPEGVDSLGTVIELLDKQGKVLLRNTHRFDSSWSTVYFSDTTDLGYRDFQVKVPGAAAATASIRITFPGCNPVTFAKAPQPVDEYGERAPHTIEVTRK